MRVVKGPPELRRPALSVMRLILASLSFVLCAGAQTPMPSVTWEGFYERVGAEGVVFSPQMKELAGKRVRLRGFSVEHPGIEGGLFLTRFPHEDPHGVEEHDLPFDAVAVIWRKDIALPPVPPRPTVEGVLRLGNRAVSEGEVVTVTLEDATPVIERARSKRKR